MAVEQLQQSRSETPRVLTGAGAVWQSLVDHRITRVFGYPGGANLPLYHELRNAPSIRHTLVRHEGGAAYMASGYGRIKDEVGVMIATSGPGGLNLVTGLRNMLDDSTAGLAITGQVAKASIGTQAFQEANMVGTIESNVKWSHQIQDADEIPQRIAEAMYIATSGRPGPVHLDIPKDVQLQPTEYSTPITIAPEQKELTAEALAGVQKIPDLIKEAKKPLIIAGHGVILSGAQSELLEYAEKTGIPVAYTLHASSAIAPEHPLNAGLLGMHGNYGPNVLSEEADLVIVLGARLDDRVTGKVDEYLPNAKIVQIDTDPDQLGKHKPNEVAIVADVKSALTALQDLTPTGEHGEWLGRIKDLNQLEYDQVISQALSSNEDEVKMAQVVDSIYKKTGGDAILVADVGMHQMFAARHFPPGRLGRYLTSGGLGAMGYGLPAAIGAKMATREMGQERDVVAVVGDGGAQMTIQELMVAAAERVGVGMVVLNNHALGMVEEWQDLFHNGNRAESSRLPTPNFAGIATAGYGIQSERIENLSHLYGALDEMFRVNRSGHPYLLEVIVPEDKVFPMIPPGSPAHKMILGPNS
jgi:acetolactate synthase I/II/III large subunit